MSKCTAFKFATSLERLCPFSALLSHAERTPSINTAESSKDEPSQFGDTAESPLDVTDSSAFPGTWRLDLPLGDLARSRTEIWLDRMPISPTGRYFVQVDCICENWPTSHYRSIAATRFSDLASFQKHSRFTRASNTCLKLPPKFTSGSK